MTSTSTSSLAIISIDSLAAALTKLGVNVSITTLRDTVVEEEAGKPQNQIERLLATPALDGGEASILFFIPSNVSKLPLALAPNPSFFAKPYTLVRGEASPEGLREETRLLIELTKEELLHPSDQADSASQAADIEDLAC